MPLWSGWRAHREKQEQEHKAAMERAELRLTEAKERTAAVRQEGARRYRDNAAKTNGGDEHLPPVDSIDYR